MPRHKTFTAGSSPALHKKKRSPLRKSLAGGFVFTKCLYGAFRLPSGRHRFFFGWVSLSLAQDDFVVGDVDQDRIAVFELT